MGRYSSVASLLDDAFVERQIIPVEIDRRVERVLCRVDSAHVIEMRVREQDVLDLHLAVAHRGEELIDFVARVDHDRRFRALAADDEPVLVERRDGPDFQNHHLQS